jgi:hypothetical protein
MRGGPWEWQVGSDAWWGRLSRWGKVSSGWLVWKDTAGRAGRTRRTPICLSTWSVFLRVYMSTIQLYIQVEFSTVVVLFFRSRRRFVRLCIKTEIKYNTTLSNVFKSQNSCIWTLWPTPVFWNLRWLYYKSVSKRLFKSHSLNHHLESYLHKNRFLYLFTLQRLFYI